MVDETGCGKITFRCPKCAAFVSIYSDFPLYRNAFRCASCDAMGVVRPIFRSDAPQSPRYVGQCDEEKASSETRPAHSGAPTALETD